MLKVLDPDSTHKTVRRAISGPKTLLKDVVVAHGVAITPIGIRQALARKVKDMKDVMMKPSDSEEVVYEVYRDVMPTNSYDIRVDLTMLRSEPLPDGELPRTHGHRHPVGPWGKPWPEIYCVLKGKGTFLLHDDVRAYLVEVKEGDLVHVPGNMVHVLINVGEEELVTCNYVSKSFTPDYNYLKERRGPALFLTKDGVVFNKNYDLKEVKVCKPFPLELDELVVSHAVKPPLGEWLWCQPYS